jgi:geranylgeranyl reductase family protein
VSREWDVVVVGAGPAGLAAAHAAATAGARTLVLERSQHPRYKTCGGGLVGASLAALAGMGVTPPARDRVDVARFTLRGRRGFTRRGGTPLVAMVRREELDDALRVAAEKAGAVVRQRCRVRGVEQDDSSAYARLDDGTRVAGRYLVGADGSAGVTAKHVSVHCGQTDLGLELELPIGPALREQWRRTLLIDWGPLPGSYGWVFPKGDTLTVGVISARGQGDATRGYLRDFVERLGLAGFPPSVSSGHLTRCRAADSPLTRGSVLVAGDAAGLLEPWTREGISFALRSGTLAGRHAAAVARGEPGAADAYAAAVDATLGREMAAGERLLTAFERRPLVFHAAVGLVPPAWSAFMMVVRGETSFAEVLRHNRVARTCLTFLEGHRASG